ncbi:hypothetical protein NC651_033010 [Populus alba x Populus x berolinensis]|nr:hypothetical protein NC651_033010 [Populus alba x Populus x berolinensis]
MSSKFCNLNKLNISCPDFRQDMLVALLSSRIYSRRGGMFINSCFAQCQSESQDTWFARDSPQIHSKGHVLSAQDHGRITHKIIENPEANIVLCKGCCNS